MSKKQEKNTQRVGKIMRIAGIVAFLLQLVATTGLIAELVAFPILPDKYMTVFCYALGFAAIISAVLLVMMKKKVFAIAGMVWALLWMIICVVAVIYLEPTRKTLNGIAGQEATETIHVEGVSVLVRTNDPAKKLADTNGYIYGVQTAEEYAASFAAYKYIESSEKISVQLKEYEYYENLAEALVNGEIGVMIADSSYVVMLEEYVEGFSGQYRVLDDLSFDSEIPELQNLPTPTPTPSPTPGPVSDLTPVPTVPGEPDVTPEPVPSLPAGQVPTPTPYCTPFPMPQRSNAQNLTGNYFTVYFSGIDTYGAISARSRSDVNILMTVNPITKRIILVTIPRDAYVIIPGVSGSSYDKLTHAGIYGVKASMNTLENVYGIDIDYYVRVNFSSIERFVDMLGGVDVYSAVAFTSEAGYGYGKGMNHVDGKRALSFARERHAFDSGDNQRGKNQMELIKAVINKMQSPSVLNNFAGLMSTISDNFQTDISMDQMTSLVRMQLDSNPSWQIDTYAITTTGAYDYCYSYKGSKLYVGYINGDSVREASRLMCEVMAGH